jgi:integrase
MEEEIKNGWDKGLDFKIIKKKLINELERIYNQIEQISEENANKYDTKKKNLIKKLIYLTISLIQLRNGCRITEAVNAFKIFNESGDHNKKVIVKIGKSDATKVKKDGKRVKLKARYRKIEFPNEWIDIDVFGYISKSSALNDVLKCSNIKRRIFDYLTKNFNCNTHSLRYAFISYLLYEKKVEPIIVAKFVGHANTNQLHRYSQMKEVDKIFKINL